MKKKMFSALLAVAMLCAMMVPASAAHSVAETKEYMNELRDSNNPADHRAYLDLLEEQGGNVFTCTLNEYDVLEEKYNALVYGTSTVANQERQAYSEEEIEYILNFKTRLTEKVEYLDTLSDEQLEFMKYTEEQKYAIRNFDGSDEMLRAAASSVEIDGGFDDLVYTSSGGTTTKLVAYFDWAGQYTPGWLLSDHDIVGVSWDAPFQADDANTVIWLKYINENHGTSMWTEGEVIPAGKYVDGFLVPNNESQYVGNTPVGHWITEGSISIPLSTKTKQVEITGFAAYGYNTATATPSISLSAGDGVGVGAGFSFSKKVEVIDTARFYG